MEEKKRSNRNIGKQASETFRLIRSLAGVGRLTTDGVLSLPSRILHTPQNQWLEFSKWDLNGYALVGADKDFGRDRVLAIRIFGVVTLEGE
ncbi:hypothetical protein HZH66_010782 [Vespula vulgaris]|uniref:Uncharacterized protein n=1 Tax=Vespula vulgaris TaxID=7454 RepID=A0A834JH64_VESVU|nr:hypothetical protein HZH66_010782 [Vespula vulgaris]